MRTILSTGLVLFTSSLFAENETGHVSCLNGNDVGYEMDIDLKTREVTVTFNGARLTDEDGASLSELVVKGKTGLAVNNPYYEFQFDLENGATIYLEGWDWYHDMWETNFTFTKNSRETYIQICHVDGLQPGIFETTN